MPPFLETLVERFSPAMLLDIAITAFFIYWLFSLIRGTRAVTLVIGVSILIGVYAIARGLGLVLLTRILETGAFVGVFALVVVLQPELRRALERIGRVGSFGWLLSSTEARTVEHVAKEVATAAGRLSAEGVGALIVLERETGLEEFAETGIMLHADLSADLLCTIFAPRTALHDGAVIVRGDRLVAAGALLPLTETSLQAERYGTRHRAALGVTEGTDAIVVVVSEESGQMSLVERARIVRVPTPPQLERALRTLLEQPSPAGRFGRGGPGSSGLRGRLRPIERLWRSEPPRARGGRSDEGAAAAVEARR